MVYERFRAGETSAGQAWMGRTTGPQRRRLVAVTKSADPAIRVAIELPRTPTGDSRDPAGHVIQGRSILGPAGVLRYPSTSLLRATRLHTCYTALNHSRSAKSARSLLTRILRPTRARLPISVNLHLSHWSRKTGRLPIYG